MLGGSAVFFSYAASYFSPVRLVGVVGDDWPAEHTELLQKQGIDTSRPAGRAGAKTFRWRGKYMPNMNDRETLEVHLNVFEKFDPVLPADVSQVQVPVPGQRLADHADEGAGPGARRRAESGRHDGPVDQHRSTTSCGSCCGGSTAWCSTTARPSC